jgi:integrase
VTVTALHAGPAACSSARPAAGSDPHVFAGRPLRAGRALESTSRFSDDVWDLSPAMLKKHERRFILDFRPIPASHREIGKELCYAMLAGAVPPGEDRPAVATVRTAFTDYARFLKWAAGRDASVSGMTGADLEDYQRFLSTSLPNPGTRKRACSGVRKFWFWRSSLPSGGLRFDPLHLDGWSTPNARAGENATGRIPEEVLGPLFVWAMRFIDDFSADIIAADRRWRTPLPPGGSHAYGEVPAQLRAWLGERVAAGRPLPAWRGNASIAAVALELGRDRASVRRYRHLIDEAAAIAGTAPQTIGDQPVLGHLDGQPWIAEILADHTESVSLASLARLLQDAAYISLAFLSGARDSELKHLQRDCLTIERDADGTPYRWKMHSLAFKGENDPAGVPATWSIGEPAARAVTVLEQLQPPGTRDLFARLEHSPGTKPGAVSRVLTSGATNARLNGFVSWVNDYCRRHDRADGIPLVGDRAWHLVNSQFRRTLAWFIARRPGGVIAGALAYRHHCVQVFEGYAGTSESGFRAEAESEQALARGQHLMASIDAHQHTQFTGPAAGEAASRLEEFGERAGFGGKVVLDDSRLRRLMTRHDPAVYPGEYVTCVHDHSKALCEKARSRRSEGLPDHGGCKPLACHNVALTPDNVATWHSEIGKITERLAARPPLPPLLRRRLEDRRTEITAFLDRASAAGTSS